MSSSKPPRPPSFDAKSFSQRLYERVLSTAGKPYNVFDPVNDAGSLINFPRWKKWVDDKMYASVKANAVYLDEVKADLDTHIGIDNARQKALSDRVTALEEAQSSVPFPGST
jgi:hypothetical protein